ncbi:mms4 [Drosophila busckii]|uniref:Mms4 n=1 Tax=Drosophila busckii TaxID=30019 RepID=A0A0M5J4F6_DROBS|nr:crossover junction endonuclease EME1 [Drosophila busckii]ALC40631.1 mms4 [Drosophila busckii]
MSSKADKLLKQAVKEQQKRIKPGECQKYVRVILDVALRKNSELLQQLSSTDLKYDLRSLPVSNCIIWERNVGQQTLSTIGNGLEDAWRLEGQILKVYSEAEFQHALKDQSLTCIGSQLQTAFPQPNSRYVIAVPRLHQSKQRAKGSVDTALIELQLSGLHIEQLRPPHTQELLALLQRYTKAIAEMPYKQQRQEILGSFKKYLANDNKQCVRVEQGNGYGRLWQQHLNRLPLVTLEVAESIIGQYPCPKRMLEHFENDPDAVQKLADVKIKRSNGPAPLQTERRIGNVLSSKLYNLYNARDPNTLI